MLPIYVQQSTNAGCSCCHLLLLILDLAYVDIDSVTRERRVVQVKCDPSGPWMGVNQSILAKGEFLYPPSNSDVIPAKISSIAHM